MWRINGPFPAPTRLIMAGIVWCIASATYAADTSSLPLSKIVLYSSGVGYFQHDGTVRDRAQVDLRFNVNQVNDLLKSLVIQDSGGGKVASVSYGSRDPIAKRSEASASI